MGCILSQVRITNGPSRSCLLSSPIRLPDRSVTCSSGILQSKRRPVDCWKELWRNHSSYMLHCDPRANLQRSSPLTDYIYKGMEQTSELWRNDWRAGMQIIESPLKRTCVWKTWATSWHLCECLPVKMISYKTWENEWDLIGWSRSE